MTNYDYKVYVYDLEQLANFHSASFLPYDEEDTTPSFGFVIHELQDDRVEYFKFLEHLQQNNKYLIGFNNINYDYPLLHYILRNKWRLLKCTADECARLLKQESDKIISKEFSAINQNDVLIPQIDFFKIKHYDGKAKRGTS
jgi:hypothetical protein